MKERTVWEVFEAADRPALIAYLCPFDGFHALPASVSKTLLVRFDYNKYSVHAAAAGRPVEIHLHSHGPVMLHAPPRVLQVVVSNLLRNACSYTDEGRIDVDVDRSMLRVVAEQHRLLRPCHGFGW